MSYRKDWKTLPAGQLQYEGFCIDLLQALSKECHFHYNITPVADNKYGAPNEKGEWNGMVKELIEKVSLYRRVYYEPIDQENGVNVF